jgi:hypothetical protein
MDNNLKATKLLRPGTVLQAVESTEQSIATVWTRLHIRQQFTSCAIWDDMFSVLFCLRIGLCCCLKCCYFA